MDTIQLHPRSARVTPAALKQFMNGYFTGVTIVTSVDGAGRPHGLTCNSLVSVTLDPPTLLVCLDRGSGTLTAVRERGAFAVNLLSEQARAAAEVFASPDPDRFAAVAWQPSPHGKLPQLTDDAFAFAECMVTDLHAVGDHVVVFGRVLDVAGEPRNPLLYGMRTFTGPPVPSAAGSLPTPR
ncbi:flavin reductase family protein [Actinophytocola sp.]|uniref:flavin reductase family protein n=1 Tax=Actinophytocola sp. TaxID=1872138 RepID=UPI002ED2FD72